LYDAQTLLALAAGFALPDPPTGVAPLGQGLINVTFALDAGAGRYVLQRINRDVFPFPERIMANLEVLAAHLSQHPHPGLHIPTPIPTPEGASFVLDADGQYWRLMERVPEAETLNEISSEAQAHQVGFALGQFHRLLAGLDPTRLATALPGFHHTGAYLAQLDRSLVDHPPAADQALSRALSEVDRGRHLTTILDDARRTGRIPLRVTHGDPKLDNILFHRVNGRALALIDLDTVQPGLIQHDLGDCLRSCCNRRGESAGPEDTRFDLNCAATILRAYAAEMRDLLSGEELAGLYDGIRLIPYELGVRFLADHLAGNHYFRVTAQDENLVKALTQLALVADIERQEGPIRNLIKDAFTNP
jgi:Ser/Thr protein kinase RdoA (MazF antagonist)